MLRTWIVAFATCCAPQPSQSTAADPTWLASADAARVSPAAHEAGLTTTWKGADGRPITVAVAAPRPSDAAAAETLTPATGNFAAAFAAAIARLSKAGGGTLQLAPGTYAIANAGNSPGLLIDGARDVAIEGAGARISFAQWGDGIVIRDSARLAIRGISLGYTKPAVISATVRRVDGHTALVVADHDAIDPDAHAYQVSSVDTDGSNSRRLLLGREGERMRSLGNGRFAIDGADLSGFDDGTSIEVKLSYYKGAAIRVSDTTDKAQTHDVTIDGVEVRSAAGAGIVADLMDRGLAIVNTRIGGVGQGAATVAYDGVHVTASAGDILLRGNSIARTGDDAINLSSPIYIVDRPSVAGVIISGPNNGIGVGTALALFDANLNPIAQTKIVARQPRGSDGSMAVSFASSLPAVSAARFARNTALLGNRYAVIDNVVGPCGCHGVLAQGPNGLVRGNQFARLGANAVRLVTSAMWKEGAGAHNVVIERNQIAHTGSDGRRGVVWAAITLYADGSGGSVPGQAPILREPVHSDIAIRENQIVDVAQGCISVASSTRVRVTGNICREFNRASNRQKILIERASVADGVQRLAAKAAYLASSSGVWIDPLSTSSISVAAPER